MSLRSCDEEGQVIRRNVVAAILEALLGVSNVAVYDGSLSEWAADPTLPLETA